MNIYQINATPYETQHIWNSYVAFLLFFLVSIVLIIQMFHNDIYIETIV